ncbi:hypothetical protein Ahp2_41 [Aeromonas phage Ahp2]|nr:hypothetical protein Ahp2_41 [Aeromonas phage Ahp2]
MSLLQSERGYGLMYAVNDFEESQVKLSRTQRDALMLLVVLERRGVPMPFPGPRVLDMVNSDRWTPVARQNFQAGMKTLEAHGLVTISREYGQPLKLTLTDEGRMHGEVILSDRTQGDENERA